jgi:hypothetical protein
MVDVHATMEIMLVMAAEECKAITSKHDSKASARPIRERD